MTTSIPTKIINPIFKGNTFEGLRFTLSKKVDDVVTPVDLTDCSILIQFKLNYVSDSVFEFSTDDGTIIIEDTNVFSLLERDMNYDAHKYLSDIRITFPDGKIETMCKLEWTIKDVISYEHV
jgi:hypothetical protein